jgi:hypothetical protein
MPFPSNGTRFSRVSNRAGSRLSFANVTAVLALFVALGGSSYAAVQVGTKEIADNSVRGRDIHKDTVRGTDIRDNDLKGRDVRANTITGDDVKELSLGSVPKADNADMLSGKPASAFLRSDQLITTGLVKLAHGETKTFASAGPFTWKAACTDDGGGNTRLTITVASTEANSFAADFNGPGGGQPVTPGSPATMFDQGFPGPAYSIGFPLSAVAPSGAAPVGLAFVGIQVAGADCVVNGHLTP